MLLGVPVCHAGNDRDSAIEAQSGKRASSVPRGRLAAGPDGAHGLHREILGKECRCNFVVRMLARRIPRPWASSLRTERSPNACRAWNLRMEISAAAIPRVPMGSSTGSGTEPSEGLFRKGTEGVSPLRRPHPRGRRRGPVSRGRSRRVGHDRRGSRGRDRPRRHGGRPAIETARRRARRRAPGSPGCPQSAPHFALNRRWEPPRWQEPCSLESGERVMRSGRPHESEGRHGADRPGAGSGSGV